ncbi:MAG: sigma-70 family RNA polymerase sigma factor [Actinomycetota bacterium]|nr:sigma-70 family RNA polymerase sigma factor [Actinomycetota bacterium]
MPRPDDPCRPRGGSDAELAARHRHGDPAAFAALHDRYAAALRSHAARLVGHGQADDVVQEAFERAHRFLLTDERAGGDDLALGAWLHTVLRHRCIDHLRRSAHLETAAEIEVRASGPGPHDRAVMAERLQRLGRAVRALPERQREALVGHALDGEPHQAVAQRLGVSVAATKNLVNRARYELRHSAAA